MKRMAAVAFVVALVATVACNAGRDGPPAIEVDRSACSHCGMLISEPRFAAAFRTSTQADARLFDDIGCLLDSVSREADRTNIRFWFKDVNTAEWIDGDRAVFIKSARLRTPMAGGFVAYSDKAAAERGAAEHEGRVIGGLENLLKDTPGGGES